MLTNIQREVISALAFANMNAAGAGRLLGKHRNSVTWHIEQIKNQTGLNPLDFFDLHELFEMAGGNDNADEKTTMPA